MIETMDLMDIDEPSFTPPTVPAGTPLEDGAVYLDLANPELGPFRALHGQVAGTKNRYLAQTGTSPDCWDQVIRACAELSFHADEETTLASLDAN